MYLERECVNMYLEQHAHVSVYAPCVETHSDLSAHITVYIRTCHKPTTVQS